MNDEHSALIKTPKQLIVVVLFSFIVPIALIMMLAALVTSGRHGGTTDKAAMLARIQPVGSVVIEPAPIPASTVAPDAAPAAPTAAAAPIVAAAIPPPAAAAASDKADGKKAYDTACVACHGTGIAGAPKVGDKSAWSARVAQGTNVLYEHAIKGFQGKTGLMPAKGGNTSLSDAEVKAAVDFMAAAVK